MYRDVALWRQVRHRMLDSGTSKRKISRETGISRPTIRKMAAFERPPCYGTAHYPISKAGSVYRHHRPAARKVRLCP
jgi:hypothetical protein